MPRLSEALIVGWAVCTQVHASTMIVLPTTGLVANTGDAIEVPEVVLNRPVDCTSVICASAGCVAIPR